jgi:hypothetical protein
MPTRTGSISSSTSRPVTASAGKTDCPVHDMFKKSASRLDFFQQPGLPARACCALTAPAVPCASRRGSGFTLCSKRLPRRSSRPWRSPLRSSCPRARCGVVARSPRRCSHTDLVPSPEPTSTTATASCDGPMPKSPTASSRASTASSSY